MSEVLCLGNFVVDVIGKPLDRLPPPGGLLLLDTLQTHLGGNAPNCAMALARLGMATAVAGRVGEDLYGRFLIEELQRGGVDTRWVSRDTERPTGLTIVAVAVDGERSFLHHFGANAAFSAADLPDAALDGIAMLHATSAFVLPATDGAPLAALLRRARERGIVTSLDVCWDRSGRWLEILAPCLPHVDLFMPSQPEAAAMAGVDSPEAMAEVFHAGGARAVVIKCDEGGCFASVAGRQWWEPAFQVAVRDATGAGDCFAAGFLCGSRRDWSIERCLRFANACGALAVSAIGATTGLLPFEEIEAWMETHRQYPAQR